jgi:DNA polymerase I-like protein with 3'-5' exonuclease and polymerase domains
MWYTHGGEPFLPIVHPAAILRQWDLRAVTVHDLKARVPLALAGDWRHKSAPTFWAPPSFEQATLKLKHWLTRAEAGDRFRLAVDIETARKLITCIGFADSVNFAMSIPFVQNGYLDSYWHIEQEIVLVDLLRRVLSHPNIELEGQNFIYDIQYLHAYFAILPRHYRDSMLMHHLLWPGTPKGLDYLSSLYCQYHWYWKEDGKEWNGTGSLSDLLTYNCWDCVRTYEVVESLLQLIPRMGMERQWAETQARADLALRMMLRGVRIDRKRRGELKAELTGVHSELMHELLTIVPQDWLPPWKKGAKRTYWPNSPKQQQIVFGDILGMKIPRHRKTGRPSLGKEALADLPNKYPEWKGLFRRLESARSVAVFQSHFIDASLDGDDRMRCSFNPAGTETFRWSSSRNAFGRGTNLQNIPAGDEE